MNVKQFVVALAGGIFYLSISGAAIAQLHDPRALDADPATADAPIAPTLGGLGDYEFDVSTDNVRSQYFFNQGLRLTYGFNHSEALRAFKEAARLDPDNAMAYWGWALVLGPNLNLPMQPQVVEQAYEAIQAAQARKNSVSERERAYIDALATRYANDPEADRAALDAAYAAAMFELTKTYPDDLDAATLYAAALMNLSPWNYWGFEGMPYARTELLLAALESVRERNPEHPGAAHYYIHAVEAVRPQSGVPAADSLRELMPGAGHMVHMPSHIYIRTGRYAEAVRSNFASIEADKRLRDEWGDRELPLDFTTTKLNSRGHHNHARNFLHMAAVRQGHYGHAIDALLGMGNNARGQKRGVQKMWLTYKRFGRWEEILEIPEAPDESPLKIGIRHYVRGFAHLADGRIDEAAAELDALEAAAAVAETKKGLVPPASMLEIAVHELAGVLNEARGDVDAAVARLGTAVRLEDGLPYMEPPRWLHPVRHTLGEVLLRAGRPREAESVFWEDLRRNPENGRALFGLQRSLEALGEDDRADRIAERFRRAWSGADTPVEAGNLDRP